MNINLVIKIDSPELLASIQMLAVALQEGYATATTAGEESLSVNSTQAIESDFKQREVEVKEITIEEVRAKLARLSQAGKQKEVKALIEKFGASKLTDILPEHYGLLLKDAEVL